MIWKRSSRELFCKLNTLWLIFFVPPINTQKCLLLAFLFSRRQTNPFVATNPNKNSTNIETQPRQERASMGKDKRLAVVAYIHRIGFAHFMLSSDCRKNVFIALMWSDVHNWTAKTFFFVNKTSKNIEINETIALFLIRYANILIRVEIIN